ncbi:uncharacterized protein LOC130406730 [Gadus chalcogrammus]|uniref:uncharacterized protein LOC130406730 n=1 Tax=Gadus chalcogrammus TaxID=1042646 RepID=UPI0024C49571|nr:uncharacterized protein LOC130406730 [Gadus chalcogrammus]
MLLDDDVINLLRYLWERNVLNEEEKKTVEGKTTSKDRAHCLIDTVMEKGKRESSLMVDYLTERRPELCSALGLNPTSALIKLGRNRSKLVDLLLNHDVTNLLRYLWEMNVLNDEEKKTVEEKTTREDRARCLIDTVMKKGDRESSVMVDYLTERPPALWPTLGLTPTSALIKLGSIRSKLVYTLSDHNVIKLLRCLWGMNVFNDKQKKTVEEKTNREAKARCLIYTVMGKGATASSLMVDYLTEKHPELCLTLGLTPTSALIKLGRIRSKFVDMLSYNDFIDLLHNLRKLNVLNDEEKKTVEGKTTTEDKARCLIDTVMGKGATAKLGRIGSKLFCMFSDHDVINLLHYLREMNMLNDEEEKTVEGKTNREDKARCLIDTVMEKGESASSLMVDYLTERHPELRIGFGGDPSFSSRQESPGLMSPSLPLEMHEGDSELDRDHDTRSAGQDLTDDQLMKVAATLGKEWKQAAILLGLKKEELDVIKAKHRPVIHNRQRMLMFWKHQRPPGEATAQDMLRGLEKLKDLPVETRRLLEGPVQNRSKPVKKKPSCSSAQGSRPGELSSSASDGTLDKVDETRSSGQDMSAVQLRVVAKTLGKRWERAAIHLGLTDEDLDDIKKEEMAEFKQRRKMLLLWKDRRPGKATAQDLLSGLEGLKVLPVNTRRSLEGLVQNRSKPVKKKLSFSSAQRSRPGPVQNRSKPVKRKPSCSGGQESLPGELSSSASDGTLDKVDETRSPGQDLSAVQLRVVAKTLGRRWERAALHLGLTDEDLDDIKKEEMAEFKQRRKMLLLWKDRRPGKATAQDLLSGLEGLKVLPVNTRRLLEVELQRVRCEFVKTVKIAVIKGLLDDLLVQKVFITDVKDSVMENERSTKDRARCLIDMVIGKGEKASRIMIASMKKRDPDLCSTLGLIPFPAGLGNGGRKRNGSKSEEVANKKPCTVDVSDRITETHSTGPTLTEKELMNVAKTLGNEWETIAIHLEITTKALEEIKAEHRSVAMQKLKMLVMWTRRRPQGKATAQDLLRGLEDMEDLPVETRLSLTALIKQ